jgi:hypothetical protein
MQATRQLAFGGAGRTNEQSVLTGKGGQQAKPPDTPALDQTGIERG